MNAYRCCLMDSKDRVKAIETADCSSDADAMMKAAEILARQPDVGAIEIWDMARLVGRAPGFNMPQRPPRPRTFE